MLRIYLDVQNIVYSHWAVVAGLYLENGVMQSRPVYWCVKSKESKYYIFRIAFKYLYDCPKIASRSFSDFCCL